MALSLWRGSILNYVASFSQLDPEGHISCRWRSESGDLTVWTTMSWHGVRIVMVNIMDINIISGSLSCDMSQEDPVNLGRQNCIF